MSTPRHEVVFVDGVRTPFGKAGDKGIYAQTRADDLVVACIRELMRRTPSCPRSASTTSRSPPPPRSATRA